MALKLYFDLMSQPSRSLYILLKASKSAFTEMPVNLGGGAHMTPEFQKINRFGKVPVIDHNGFLLTESVAIVKYLSQEKIIPEKFYPSDHKSQARVNEFLAWQHIGVRAPCALYFWAIVLDPVLTGKPTSEKKIEFRKKQMIDALDAMEEKWLGNGNKFIIGDQLTAADIFGCTEIEQPRMAGFDPKEGRPNLAAWMDRVKNELNPYYDDAHKIVDKIAKKRESKQSKL